MALGIVKYNGGLKPVTSHPAGLRTISSGSRNSVAGLVPAIVSNQGLKPVKPVTNRSPGGVGLA